MNRIGWILYSVSAIMLVIKLYVILSGQIGMLLMLNEVGQLRNWLTEYFIYYWLFIEPSLILISLVGFLLRKKKGFQISLTFGYFIIAYGVLHYLTPFNRHENFTFGILIWAVLGTVLTNIPSTVRIFSIELTRKQQLKANLLSLLIGLLLNGIMLTITA